MYVCVIMLEIRTHTWSHMCSYITFVCFFVELFLRSFIRSFIQSFNQSFIHSFIQSLTHSFIHSFTHSLIHSVIPSFLHSSLYDHCSRQSPRPCWVLDGCASHGASLALFGSHQLRLPSQPGCCGRWRCMLHGGNPRCFFLWLHYGELLGPQNLSKSGMCALELHEPFHFWEKTMFSHIFRFLWRAWVVVARGSPWAHTAINHQEWSNSWCQASHRWRDRGVAP